VQPELPGGHRQRGAWYETKHCVGSGEGLFLGGLLLEKDASTALKSLQIRPVVFLMPVKVALVVCFITTSGNRANVPRIFRSTSIALKALQILSNLVIGSTGKWIVRGIEF
jgi:hypothetical protein